MFAKFSVRKPLTIVIAVILIVILGGISFTKMTTDLLPNMDLPYVAVITTYPGASPEKVETGVTKPLEQTLATTSGVENITSVSSENSSMVLLQFAEGTNMDSVMIEMSGNIDLVKGYFDDAVSAPILMKINPDMLPVMVASVDMDGKTLEEVSRIVSEEVLPSFERIDGVASVTTMGLLEKQLTITLNQEKIDTLNARVLQAVDEQLAEAEAQLQDAEAQLADGRTAFEKSREEQTQKLASSSAALTAGRQQLQDGLDAANQAIADVQAQRKELEAQRAEMQAAMDQLAAAGMQPTEEQAAALAQLEAGIAACDKGLTEAEQQKAALSAQLDALSSQEAQLEAGKMTLNQELAKAAVQLDESAEQLKKAREELDANRDAAYEKAGLSGMITRDTISALLSAENFSMPAGSITGSDGQTYSVKVGDAFSGLEELQNWALFYIDAGNIGGVTLNDVADIAFTDNSGQSYAKINGNDGILLTFQKQSTSSTAEVAHKIQDQMEALEEDFPGMHLTALSDQGMYIDLVINSVLQNLILGGILAVVILLLFLRDLKPTLIIAVSIPVSLLFALVLMYFSGVTMNVISLAGLALGVGMLVDNSIVVIENIYRLRAEGVPAKRAAVLGAKQVAGAITASTLTTICVFLPIVFTEGISRQLFTDMGLTIAYSLVASLLIAMTLVPAMGSTVLRKDSSKKHKWFDAFAGGYQKALNFCLRHKTAVLVPVAVLLAAAVYGATVMGLSFMPDMDSSQLMVSLEMPVGTTQEETRAAGDALLDRISALEEVKTVGAMQSSGGSGMMAMMGGSDREVSFYVLLKSDRSRTSDQVSREIESFTGDTGGEITSSGSGMDMSMLTGSGVQVVVKGDDLDTLQEISADVAEILRGIEGTQEVSDGMEDASTEYRILVDKDAAMKKGLTVAQVYSEVSSALKNSAASTTLTDGTEEYPVIVANAPEDVLTPKMLEDYTFTASTATGEEEIRLGDIASLSEAQSLSSIRRESQTRTMTVSAAVDRDHNVGLVGRELEKALKDYDVPAGYTLEIAGENETINQSMQDLLLMILLAVVFIYMIMVAQFQSLRSPFIVMFTMPLAFTGGLLALWILGFDLSVISMLGFLVLAGIVVNNGIVFVDYANQLRIGGMEKREALLATGRARIRPILMTALTTILGLSTLSFGMGEGADMLQPLAIVVVGGLLYATILTLFVVPVLYDLFNRKPIRNPDEDLEELDNMESR